MEKSKKQVSESILFFYGMVPCLDSTFDSDAHDSRVLTVYSHWVVSTIAVCSSNPESFELSLFYKIIFHSRISYQRWKNRSFGMGMDEFQRSVQRSSHLHSNCLSILLYSIGAPYSEFFINPICPEHSFHIYFVLLQRRNVWFHVVLVCQYKSAFCSDTYFIDTTFSRIQRSLLTLKHL